MDVTSHVEDNRNERRKQRLDHVASLRMEGLRLVLENLEDSGNQAAIFRTCENFGILHVHIVQESEKKNARFGVFGSVGDSVGTPGNIWSKDNVEASHDNAVMPLQSLDFGSRIALVFGNEAKGLTNAMLKSCDGIFTIPSMGLSESLNVSVAAAICIHWGRHAREKALGKRSDLGDADKAELKDYYRILGSKRGFTKAIRVASATAAAADDCETSQDVVS
eukprot:UC4_evm2s797